MSIDERELQQRRQAYSDTLREFARQSAVSEGRNDDADASDHFITNPYGDGPTSFRRGLRRDNNADRFFLRTDLATNTTQKKYAVFQRDPTYLDPLARYYFGMEQDYAQERLSKSPPGRFATQLTNEWSADTQVTVNAQVIQTDVNINFNLGSLKSEDVRTQEQRERREPRRFETRLRGMSLAQATGWKRAMEGSTNNEDIAGYNGSYNEQRSSADVSAEGEDTYLVFDSQFMHGANTQENFNFAQEMVTLAKQGATDPFVAFNPGEGQRDWRDFFETDLVELRNLYGGEVFPRENLEGTDVQTILVGPSARPSVSNRMARILAVLNMTFPQFEAAYPFFTMERSVGRMDNQAYNTMRNRQDNIYDFGCVYISAVIDYLFRNVNERTALRAANAALTEAEKTQIAAGLPPLVYEFYDFRTATQVVKDGISDVLKDLPARQQRFNPNIPGAKNVILDGQAYIKPEYNFTNAEYESAIVNNYVPEAALPNFYVYDLASNNRVNQGRDPSWDSSNGQQTLRGYDKLLTLNEFVKGTLPALGTGVGFQSQVLQDYLSSYARAVKTEGLVVEAMSEVAQRYYNINSNQDEQNIYELAYGKRKNFPMYIEIGVPILNTYEGAVKIQRERDDEDQQLSTTPGDILGLNLNGSALVKNIRDAFAQESTTENVFLGRTTGVKPAEGNGWVRERRENETEEDYENYLRIERAKNVKQPEVIMKKNLKVADFQEWIEDLELDSTEGEFPVPIGSKLGPDGRGFIKGTRRSSGALVRWLQLITDNFAKNNMVMYEDFITGRKHLCQSETILLKLEKFSVNENGFKTLIQNYYFPNFRKKYPAEGEGDRFSRLRGRPPIVDVPDEVIKFVDTQVKYDKQYYYELKAYDIVYGSKFEFRTRNAIFPSAQTPAAANSLAFFSFNVNTKPNVKVVEYPVISDLFRERTRRTTEQIRNRTNYGGYPIGETLVEAQIGGVAYPKTRVKDVPPLPPEVSIFGYQQVDNKVLINLSPTVGKFLGSDALSYIAFDAEEKAALDTVSEAQRNANPNVPIGKIQYTGRTDGIIKMLIYRTDEMNTSVSSYNDLYKNFSGKIHKVLDLSENATEEQKAVSYDFIDDLEANRKYYYTFRIRNYRDEEDGNLSNPTAIYEVELKNEDGFQTAYIQEYLPVLTSKQTPSKKMTRFIEIKASDLMSNPIKEISPSDGYLNSREGEFISKRSLLDQDGAEGIITTSNNQGEPGKQFIIRLTSRDTGRKIDIAVDFRRKPDIIKQ
jgi:hypothetical protein